MKLTIVIPTFKRVNLLEDLLSDIGLQKLLPELVVISDGDNHSGTVQDMLTPFQKNVPWNTIYIPSNHANAPYQRYLGARVANHSDILIFIDDDIRLPEKDILEKVLRPFLWQDRIIVGVSPKIKFPNRINPTNERELTKAQQNNLGGITPTGNRIVPIDTGDEYDTVRWLRGGMMAYRYGILEEVIYSPDAFAMSHIGCGLGVDDTYLSRCVGAYGELLIANCAEIEHPDFDTSKVFPQDARRKGIATAYSRRFLNDHYRVIKSPKLSDRMALLKSFLGNSLINWWQAINSRQEYQFNYARGYSRGALRGIIQKPTACNLTPEIDWLQDAEAALAQATIIS